MSSPLDLQKVAFFDVEASGLHEDSFPIEVGWAFLDGRSGSFLIRPAIDWNEDQWDPLAEEIHNISLQMLLHDGLPARDVAESLNDLLSRCALALSDSHLQDSIWLDRLYSETPQNRFFELDDEERWRSRIFPKSRRESEAGGVRTHRAAADADDLAQVWRDLRAG